MRHLILGASYAALAFHLSSCHHSESKNDSTSQVALHAEQRSPAQISSADENELKKLYSLTAEKQKLEIQLDYLGKKKSDSVDLQNLNQKIKTQNNIVLQNKATSEVPSSITRNWPELAKKLGRYHEETFILHNEKFYSNIDAPKKFFLSFQGNSEVTLRLYNRLWTWNDPIHPPQKKVTPGGPHAPNPQPQDFLKAQFICSGPAGIHKNFNWYDSGQNKQRIKFKIAEEMLPCRLDFYNPKTKDKKNAIQFETESNRTVLASFQNTVQTCYLPEHHTTQSLDDLFLTSKYNSMSCPQKISGLKSLPGAEEAFLEKVESLLGQKPSLDFINNKDPFATLDFSKTPKLDVILASYLVFRSDFYGQTLKRLMEYHAQRGAEVRILTSDVVSLNKDRHMLLDFMASNPTAKVVFYDFDARPGTGLKESFSELHRTNHIKMLLTYSVSNPKANRVIVGGRNVHDGFLYHTNPGHKNPLLITYDKDEPYTFWEDYDVLVNDTAFTQNAMAQFMAFWNYDRKTFYMRSHNLNVTDVLPTNPELTSSKAEETYVRHFVSEPFNDKMSLERLFIEMIDTAKKEVIITSPYFSPTPAIGKAFDRAVDRGVKVTVITRLNLDRDTADIILSDINKKAVNKFLGKIKVFEFTTAGKILHRKLFVVDDNIAIVGSVNLNQRSFYHDFENALIVRSHSYNQDVRHLVDLALQESKEITEKQKIAFWKKIIISILKREF